MRLRQMRALKQGVPLGVDKCGIDKVRVAEHACRRMPLTLAVPAQDRSALMILRRRLRVVFDQDVVEALRPGLVSDFDSRCCADQAAARPAARRAVPENRRRGGVLQSNVPCASAPSESICP